MLSETRLFYTQHMCILQQYVFNTVNEHKCRIDFCVNLSTNLSVNYKNINLIWLFLTMKKRVGNNDMKR